MDGGATNGTQEPHVRWPNAWYRLWYAYVIAGCIAAIVVVVILDERFPGNKLGAMASILGILAWALVFGKKFLQSREFGVRAAVFATGLIALFALGLYFSPNSLAVLPVLYPLIFMSLRPRAAVVVTALLGITPLVATLYHQGPDSPVLPMTLAISLIAFLLSPVIGLSVTAAFQLSQQQAQLLDELSASRAEMERLSHAAGTAGERARLAREIHDTLAQGFTSIVTLAQAIESEIDTSPETARRHIELIRRTARENLEEARAMVGELTPSALAGRSLVDSIERQVRRLTDEVGITVTVSADPALPKLSTPVEVVLLRAAQEAFANVRRHSAASAVTVDLTNSDGTVRMSVSDDGIGFDAPDVQEGFGLRGMRERAEQIGGIMSVRSIKGSGTTIEVEVQV